MDTRTGPLSRKQYDAIKNIMGDRRFVVLHYGVDGKAYSNTSLERGDMLMLVQKSADALRRNAFNETGYVDE